MGKRILKIGAGVVLILLGVISGFIPIVQGWIFVGLGILLLAEEVPFLNRYLKRLKQRYPKEFEKAHAFRQEMKNKLLNMFRRKRKET